MLNKYMKLIIILMIIMVIFSVSCRKNKTTENIDVSIDLNNNGEYFNIKIIREENNGRMNIIPCKIYIYNNNMELINNKNVNIFTHINNLNIKQENRVYSNYFYLIGGETAFLILPNDNYYIKVVTSKEDQIEYLPNHNNDWESIIYNFNIMQDKYNEIRIIPGSGNEGYNGTWEIE